MTQYPSIQDYRRRALDRAAKLGYQDALAGEPYGIWYSDCQEQFAYQDGYQLGLKRKQMDAESK